MSSHQIAKDVLSSFANQGQKFGALKTDFSAAQTNHSQKANGINLDLAKRRQELEALEALPYDSADHLIRDLKKELTFLEKLHLQKIPNMITAFEKFFESLDKILKMEIGDSAENNLLNEVDKASKNLVAIETIFYAEPIRGFREFHDLFVKAFNLFTPLAARAYPSGIDSLVRPRTDLLDLADKKIDTRGYMREEGLYHRHSAIITSILNSYLRDMKYFDGALPPSFLSQPEITSIVHEFQFFQHNLYPRLLQTTKADYKERLALDISEPQMQEILKDPLLFQKHFRQQLSKFSRGDFEANKAIIEKLLTLDAYRIFNNLRQELGTEPNREEYCSRIEEKINPTAVAIRLKLPGDIKKLLDSVAYRSSYNLNFNFHNIAANKDYGFTDAFRRGVENQSQSLANDLLKSSLHTWLDIDSQNPMRQFISKASTEIFSKFDREFHNKHGKDPIMALKTAFETFSMKGFKDYLNDIVDLALKNNVDKKELLKFVYLISKLFIEHASLNKEDTLTARASRPLRAIFSH